MSHNSNRSEAIRCKELAEKLMCTEDYMSARDKLVQSKKLYPSLENIDSMLTVSDILSAASLEFPGCKIDYYWILQLKPSANEADLKSKSQKLVSLLQPIKKTFPGTDLALQLVKVAFVVLSDREKRASFDSKRLEGWDGCWSGFCGDFEFDHGNVATVDVSADSLTGNKRVFNFNCTGDVSDGTVAKRVRRWEDGLVGNADEIDKNENSTSSTIVKSSINADEEAFEVGQIWAAHHREKFPFRYGRINSKTDYELSVSWLKPVPFMEDERRWCEAGFPVACGSFELDWEMNEEKVDGRKVFSKMCSWVRGVTEEQYEIYPKAGEVWAVFEDWDLAEWSSNLEVINSCKFKIVEILTNYSKYVGALVVCLVKVEGFNSIFKREVDEGYETSYYILPNSLYMFSHKIPAHRFTSGDMNRVEEGMLELDTLALSNYVVDINSFDEQSSSDISDVTHASEYIPPMGSYSTQSYKLILCGNDFTIGQVWAIYSGNDAMPRRYVLINNVISNSQVSVTVLEPYPVLDYEICWEKKNLPIVCGVYRVGKTVLNLEMSWFSHSVKCHRSKNQLYYKIYPRKGDIWAMYTNWNKKWKQADFSNYQYRVVEILEDFSEGTGTRVARLVEVKGCMTFFQRHRHDGFELIRAVSKDEMLSFSHRIPAFTVPGIERYNIPESALHLEPDALPPRSRK